ncbi:MAG: PD-(D/E)XK nuclease family protein [Verrucomicrobiota bacterium]|nr:PD-(D/E)XK nuclease family protein [Verrucomicrobiota bacterium]
MLTSGSEWLLAGETGAIADLRGTLLLLPTRQAGRRLRETLAGEMAKHGGGLFPPQMATPALMLTGDEVDDSVADTVACHWHWVTVLQGEALGRYAALFPRLPSEVDFNWCRQMARSLHELRGILVDADCDCAAVAASGHGDAECARWGDLAILESAYRASLAKVGLRDTHDAKRAAAAKPVLPGGVRRIVLMGITDLTPLVQFALCQAAAHGMIIESVVFGPKGGEELFDNWGRPVPERWAKRELPMANDQLHPSLDERTQSRDVVNWLKRYKKNVYQTVCFGTSDPKVIPHLERELRGAGIRHFDPAGQPIRRTSLHAFLQSLLAVLQYPTFINADALLRLPDTWCWLAQQDDSIQPTDLLRGLDELRLKHIPVDLAAATRLEFVKRREDEKIGSRITARNALRQMQRALGKMAKEPLSVGLAGFLKTTFDGREFDSADPADETCIAAVTNLNELLAKLDAAVPDRAKRHAAQELALVLDDLGRGALFPDRPADTIDLQGWLELAWEDAPHLIVAGANEGLLPESIHGDRFLPESLRAPLGLRSNDDRFARDAWLLELLVSSRGRDGRVDFFIGRQRHNGDPLKPSRLLFRCPDDQLAKRVEQLFADLPPGGQPPAWTATWPLRIESLKPVEHLSPTSIKAYLACPYRFYLRHVLRMESRDFDLREQDAREFGSLVHRVMELFGKDQTIRNSTSSEAIYNFLVAELKQQVEEDFGTEPPLPLRVQQQIIERRLHHVAIVQTRERVAGWEIVEAERKFEKTLDGMTIRGTIDRVERNVDTGVVRVLDYKTSSTAKEPSQTHWGVYLEERDAEIASEYARLDGRDVGKRAPQRWLDLQLPIYAWAIEEEHGAEVEVGYFNIPSVGTNTGVSLLLPFDTGIQSSAMGCACGVVKDVASERFWPAATKLKYDDYESILFDQPEGTAAKPGEVLV